MAVCPRHRSRANVDRWTQARLPLLIPFWPQRSNAPASWLPSYAIPSERIQANPYSTAAVFEKVETSSLQSPINGARFDLHKESGLFWGHPSYFTLALFAPAVQWRCASPDRQHAMCLHRDFRSSFAHRAIRYRTGSDSGGPSIQAALTRIVAMPPEVPSGT